MAELLLELFSEEIPARMQSAAAERLKEAVLSGLKEHGLSHKTVDAYATPRRLTLVVDGIPKTQSATSEERRGPRTDAPEQALEGFLRSTGLKKSELEVRTTPKGEFYFAILKTASASASDALTKLLQEVLAKFSWPKSMRWGSRTVRWVRPLHSILCLFDGEVLPIAFGSVKSSDKTSGHRFLAPKAFAVKDAKDYQKKLLEHKVMLCANERKEKIQEESERLARSHTANIVEDAGLLDEVTGLVEWPVPLIGKIDDRFMSLPPEVLQTAMRSHQKYFSLAHANGEMAPYFVTVANIESQDHGQRIIAGNERVLRARLEDAKFFWDLDRRHGLDSRLPALKNMIFHAKLGSVYEKVERVVGLAKLLAVWVPHANLLQVERAAWLCKADLTTEMVGEFPELQGLMGSYYASESKEAPEISVAIKSHYSPLGPKDKVPFEPVSIAVALADKIDTLVGLFAVGEKPTGSKDPFALRRAALGVIRIILENNIRMPLHLAFEKALNHFKIADFPAPEGVKEKTKEKKERIIAELVEFFADRLKVLLRDQSISYDLIEAVFDGGHEDDLERLVRRVKALDAFIDSEDGADLLAAYRRASNIVSAEEKKDEKSYQGQPKKDLLVDQEEIALYQWFDQAKSNLEASLKAENYEETMKILAGVRDKIDNFFDNVIVNCDNAATRKNRLLLVSQFRSFLNQVADFSKIEK